MARLRVLLLLGRFDRPWDRPAAALAPAAQAWLLNEAAFDLRALVPLTPALGAPHPGAPKPGALVTFQGLRSRA